jgi:hypothetical protein
MVLPKSLDCQGSASAKIFDFGEISPSAAKGGEMADIKGGQNGK